MSARLTGTLILFTLLVAGCDSGSSENDGALLDSAQGQYGLVGSVSGTDALIGLLISDATAQAYVCSSAEEISEWFSATIGDRTNFTLQNEAGASVTVAFEGGQVIGTVTLRDGAQHSFAAAGAGTGEGGIYRIQDAEATAQGVAGGWVVAPDGVEKGAFRIRTVFRAAPRRPKFGDITDGTSNTVVLGESRFSFSRLSRR